MRDDGIVWAVIWREAKERLTAAGFDSADQEVRWMIEDVAGIDPGAVPHDTTAVATRHLARFDDMLTRRLAGEPLQYVLGHWSFRDLDLLVDRRVLIPRPETEVVVGLALDELARSGAEAPVAVDLGTGSGAIALSLVREHRTVEVWAVDASAAAVEVARANAAGSGGRAAARLRIVEGDWFAPLPDELRGSIDLVVSNPPYIAEDEVIEAAVADWEPVAALRAGADGLRDLHHLVDEAHDWLAPGGSLVLEHAPDQADGLVTRAAAVGYVDAAIERDLAGRARAVRLRRAARRTGRLSL
ncbi:MAG: peptide chain release factor N(5)-glutamine methyltransferase [Actinomycetota bacterium]